MRVCLLNPKYGKGQRAHRIPLGLSYIAAMLLKEGYKVVGYNLDVDEFDDYANFDVFGIYCSTPMYRESIKLAKKIKELNPSAEIIFGGPHATAEGKNIIKEECVDYVIPKEGEHVFRNLLNSLYKVPILLVPGVYQKGTLYEEYALKTNLDDLPMPAKEVFDHGNYPDKKFAYSAIIASRGCPYQCWNCKPGLDNISPYRVRTPKLVVDEMEYLKEKYGARDFSFEDSELIISKTWTMEFCREIINRELNITFQGNARLNQLDDGLLGLLKQAGCRRLGIGIESGSQRVLDHWLHKGINLEQDLPRFNKIKEHGIESHAWIMIGIPGETVGDLMETIDMTKKLNATSVEINIATPWPDTAFFIMAKKKGWLTEDDSTKYDEKRKSVLKTPYLSPEEIENAYNYFTKELNKDGWIRWSTESNTFAKAPSFKAIIRAGIKKVLSGRIGRQDFQILKQIIKMKGK